MFERLLQIAHRQVGIGSAVHAPLKRRNQRFIDPGVDFSAG